MLVSGGLLEQKLSTLNIYAQDEASRLARQAQRDLMGYQNLLPTNTRSGGGAGMCRAEGWNISFQQLDGEFDLDEVLAKNVIASVQTSTPSAVPGSWLEQYLLGDVTGDTGSGARFVSEFNNAVAGPGNILGNINALKQAGNARIEKSTADALREAARRIETGAARSIKINEYMTLYNANKTGKGRPRPRIRISGMPMQVVTPALSQGMRAAASGVGHSAAMRSTEILKAQRLGGLAASSHWTGKAAFLNGKIGGGVLTFAPSAALDVYNSIERDMSGDMRFNRQKFIIASAKSQSGNLLGMVGGAGAILIGGFFLAGAPLILVGLAGGIAVQFIWGATGMADQAGSAAERALKP
jgi:hypothetical protein